MQKGTICTILNPVLYGKKRDTTKRLHGLTVEVAGVKDGVAVVKVIENTNFSIPCDSGLAGYTQHIDENNVERFPEICRDIENCTLKTVKEILHIVNTETETGYDYRRNFKTGKIVRKKVTRKRYDNFRYYFDQNYPNFRFPQVTTKMKTSKSIHYGKNVLTGFSFTISTDYLRPIDKEI